MGSDRLHRHTFACGCALVALLLASPAAPEEIYRWVDDQGRLHFSEDPPPADSGRSERWEADGTERVIEYETPARASSGEPGVPSAPAEEPEARAEPEPGAASPAAAAPEDEQIGGLTRGEWQERAHVQQERVTALETQLEKLDEEPPVFVRPTGHGSGDVPESTHLARSRLERDLAAAQTEFESLEDTARESGVPPGWLR